ncbi:MAG: hypothetical protein AB9882_11955 [Ignavibacteriaceae bacterium]
MIDNWKGRAVLAAAVVLIDLIVCYQPWIFITFFTMAFFIFIFINNLLNNKPY